MARDTTWFDPLHRDLADGGLREFLNLLLTLRLGSWHPRAVPKTEELAHQQLMSAGSVEQWLLACAEADALVGDVGPITLAKLQPIDFLYKAYCGFTRQRGGGLAVSNIAFGRVMKEVCGQKQRLPAKETSSRPWGYAMPDGRTLRQKVKAKLKV